MILPRTKTVYFVLFHRVNILNCRNNPLLTRLFIRKYVLQKVLGKMRKKRKKGQGPPLNLGTLASTSPGGKTTPWPPF